MNLIGINSSINLKIKPYDIDVAGHVNNAVYIYWLEDLRCGLFNKFLPFEELLRKDIYLVVASTSIIYKMPLTFFDKPVGKIRIENYNRGIWILSAIIECDNKTAVKATQKCVMINIKSKKMIKPEVLKELQISE